MTINMSVLWKHFERTFELYDLAEEVFTRMLDGTELYDALDDVLIPTSNQWKMMKQYQSPNEADYYKAYDEFYDDLSNALSDGVLEDE